MDRDTFLLVEDSASDAVLLQRAFRRAGILNPLQVVITGEQAIAYLSGHGKYSDRSQYPVPAVMLLDLNLPGIDGFEVLDWIRGQPVLKAIRIIILTASDDMRNVDRAYKSGANSYLVKPDDLDELVTFAQALGGYWQWSPAPVKPA